MPSKSASASGSSGAARARSRAARKMRSLAEIGEASAGSSSGPCVSDQPWTVPSSSHPPSSSPTGSDDGTHASSAARAIR